MSNLIRDLRESLSADQIVKILAEYGITPVHETNSYIQYPTVCHNYSESNSSHKLYYYKNSGMFKCYTRCNDIFDIFELLQKIHNQMGDPITIPEAIRKTGLDPNTSTDFKTLLVEAENADITKLEQIKETELPKPNKLPKIEYDNILDRYLFNETLLKPWINEGIGLQALNKFQIKYDTIMTAIIIPHRDKDGDIVGIRQRFMDPDSKVKYMPVQYAGKTLSHQIRENLYGLYENSAAIKKMKTVVIFEGEKSVLKFDTYFPGNNISVAACGSNISNEQIQLLQDFGIQNVILAFDKQYQSAAEREKLKKKYNSLGKRLSIYFNTSIIFDFGELLDFKDSPIDQGRHVFEELYKYRYYI